MPYDNSRLEGDRDTGVEATTGNEESQSDTRHSETPSESSIDNQQTLYKTRSRKTKFVKLALLGCAAVLISVATIALVNSQRGKNEEVVTSTDAVPAESSTVPAREFVEYDKDDLVRQIEAEAVRGGIENASVSCPDLEQLVVGARFQCSVIIDAEAIYGSAKVTVIKGAGSPRIDYRLSDDVQELISENQMNADVAKGRELLGYKDGETDLEYTDRQMRKKKNGAWSMWESGRRYYKWADSKDYSCGYNDCWGLYVADLEGCSRGIYIRANLNADDVAVGWTNVISPAVASDEGVFVRLDDTTGYANSIKITEMNCLG
ncbi:hypothetical protein SAMN06309944_1987 [Micrococcales bacterium KH10]|nr:hypothetical protein SAMN06309944_1987 [Micrococcales bacterium KH10]